MKFVRLAVLMLMCGCADDSQFDNVVGTLCVLNERLSVIEKRLDIHVEDTQKMKCQNFNPTGRITPTPEKLPGV